MALQADQDQEAGRMNLKEEIYGEKWFNGVILRVVNQDDEEGADYELEEV